MAGSFPFLGGHLTADYTKPRRFANDARSVNELLTRSAPLALSNMEARLKERRASCVATPLRRGSGSSDTDTANSRNLLPTNDLA